MVYRILLFLGLTGALLTALHGQLGSEPYIGSNAKLLTLPGCNASSFAQLPNDPALFVGRQLLTADGRLAPPGQANDCSGGNPDNQKIGKSFNRWSLMLDRFDWGRGKFEVVKPLLDTSIDPETGVSHARITGGPMKGAIIRSAYDPSIAVHKGIYYLAYECTVENGAHFGAPGTSSCVSVYDPRSATIDLARTGVVISGVVEPGLTWAAAIPRLLEWSGKLYMYWSAGERDNGNVVDWRVRGTELLTNESVPTAKGSNGPVPSTTRLATDLWQRQDSDRLGGSIFDIFAIYEMKSHHYVFHASGGPGCFSPSGTTAGCYHLSISDLARPLQANGLNTAKPLTMNLPTNPVEYAIPVTDPAGRVFLMGHFIRPANNGLSELRPMPNREFWDSHKAKSVYAMAPLFD